MNEEWPDWIVKPKIAPNSSQYKRISGMCKYEAIWLNVRGANTVFATLAN